MEAVAGRRRGKENMVVSIVAMVLPVLAMIALGRFCASSGILND